MGIPLVGVNVIVDVFVAVMGGILVPVGSSVAVSTAGVADAGVTPMTTGVGE